MIRAEPAAELLNTQDFAASITHPPRRRGCASDDRQDRLQRIPDGNSGTWHVRRAETGVAQWYEPGSPFCALLDSRLAALGSSARTWRHVRAGGRAIFTWSGRNTWTDRYRAAQALAAYLQDLIGQGWSCHVVAHSHGGNVLLEALRLMTEPLNYTIEKYGYSNLVCLGTPFLPPAGRPLVSARRSRRELAASLALLATVAILARKQIVASLPRLGWLWILVLSAWALATGFLAFSFLLQEPPGGETPEWKRLLVVGSKRDEVFQLLAQAFQMPNPFGAPAAEESGDPSRSRLPGRLGHWFQALGSVIAESDRIRYPGRDLAGKGQFGLPNRVFVAATAGALVALIFLRTIFPGGLAGSVLRYLVLVAALSLAACAALFAGSLKAAICLPARMFHAAGLLGGALRGEIAAGWFRRSGWNLLRRAALGVDGYPVDLPAASLTPDFLRAEFYEFQELSGEAEREALAARERSVAGTLAALTEALTQPLATEELLRVFEQSPALVHAAYYRYPACIDLIAQWIARTDEALEDRDPRFRWENETEDRDQEPSP